MLFGKPNWGWGANCDLYRGLFNLSAALVAFKMMHTFSRKPLLAMTPGFKSDTTSIFYK